MIDPLVAHVRRQVCELSCDQRCAAYLAGKVNHDDPHTACPRKGWILAWGCYGPCAGPTPTYRAGPTVAANPIAEPTVTELAANFAGAMGRWTAAGFPTVTREAYDNRAAVCDACEHWDGAARLGLGKCGAPGCGCSGFKRWLATERCPLGKWSTL